MFRRRRPMAPATVSCIAANFSICLGLPGNAAPGGHPSNLHTAKDNDPHTLLVMSVSWTVALARKLSLQHRRECTQTHKHAWFAPPFFLPYQLSAAKPGIFTVSASSGVWLRILMRHTRIFFSLYSAASYRKTTTSVIYTNHSQLQGKKKKKKRGRECEEKFYVTLWNERICNKACQVALPAPIYLCTHTGTSIRIKSYLRLVRREENKGGWETYWWKWKRGGEGVLQCSCITIDWLV